MSDDGLNLPPPYRDETESYSAYIEHNVQVTPSNGIEITEFYDGKNNVGAAFLRTLGSQPIAVYSYLKNDEVLLVEDDKCFVLTQEQSLSLSPFLVYTDKNNKSHIATPLSLLSAEPDVPRAYLGSRRTVRGMPVRQWQACVYSEQKKSTLKITFSYTSKLKHIALAYIYNI